MGKYDDLPEEVWHAAAYTDMANEPQHEEVTEEEKRRWNEEEKEKWRWDEEEAEERTRNHAGNEHLEDKAAQVNDYKMKGETDEVVKNNTQCDTDTQVSNLSDSLANESHSQEELTLDQFPQEIKDIIARLRIKVDDSDLSLKQAQDLIHELARLLDERGLCERHNITKIIKEILKDEIRTGKVTGRWIERCLPPAYKRTYVKSELSSLSSSKRKGPYSASMKTALVPPIQVLESGHSIQQPRESDDTNADNDTVTNSDKQSGENEIISLLDMNRAEREEYVISLYKENKSTREIAKLTHMSFRDIGVITKKLKLEAGGERGSLEEDDDIKSKSKTTQALKLFSDLESPVVVAIALDLPVDQVRTIYREYWQLEGMYRLAQIYDEAKYDVHDLLRLHKIVKNLGIQKQDIINVLELVKNNQLETLQSKAGYLRSEINTLEWEKKKSTNQLFELKWMIHEYEETLAQKRGEMAYLNRECRKLRQRFIDYNTHNLHPIAHSEPDTNSHFQIVPYNKE